MKVIKNVGECGYCIYYNSKRPVPGVKSGACEHPLNIGPRPNDVSSLYRSYKSLKCKFFISNKEKDLIRIIL